MLLTASEAQGSLYGKLVFSCLKINNMLTTAMKNMLNMRFFSMVMFYLGLLMYYCLHASSVLAWKTRVLILSSKEKAPGDSGDPVSQ